MLLRLSSVVLLFVLSTLPLGAAEKLPERGISAHRGENGVFQENTVAGYQEAVRLGAAQIEIDVRRTKDGHLIMMHDPTVDRTTNGKGKVADLTFDEIRALDAGIKKGERFAGTKVPTFEESLDCMPRNIWINVHVTSGQPTDVAVEVARIIFEKDRQHQAYIMCGDRRAETAVRKAFPKLLFCNLESPDYNVSQLVRETIERKCDFILLWKLGTPEEMKALKTAGIRSVYCCCGRNLDRFREVIEAGVDFPQVDNIGMFHEVAKEVFNGKLAVMSSE